MSFASHGKKHLFSHGSWITSTVYPVFNCCTVSDEYLHILLNIYLFMYLIHFGDGDREIIEALNVRLVKSKMRQSSNFLTKIHGVRPF